MFYQFCVMCRIPCFLVSIFVRLVKRRRETFGHKTQLIARASLRDLLITGITGGRGMIKNNVQCFVATQVTACIQIRNKEERQGVRGDQG